MKHVPVYNPENIDYSKHITDEFIEFMMTELELDDLEAVVLYVRKYTWRDVFFTGNGGWFACNFRNGNYSQKFVDETNGLREAMKLTNHLHHAVMVSLRKKTFTLNTLVHEFTHYRQHKRGELMTFGNMGYWKGKVYHNHDGKENYRGYRKLPWEVEARAEAARIVKKWRRKNSLFTKAKMWIIMNIMKGKTQ